MILSDTGQWQEIVALGVAGAALLFLVIKLTGFAPMARRRPSKNVVVSDRLARGLRANKRG